MQDGVQQMSLEAFQAALIAQGVPREHFALICPRCETVQSAADLIAAGAGADFEAVEGYLGFSCFGRFTKAGGHKDDTPPGKGCDWTLGGMFKLHKLVVVLEDGSECPRFQVATQEQAQEHWHSNTRSAAAAAA